MTHLSRRVSPIELLALFSWMAMAGIAVAVWLGHARAPFGSLEVLVVPLLSTGLLFPCIVLMRRLSVAPIPPVTALAGGARLRAIARTLAIGSILALAWLLYGRLLTAQWSSIDDHEIMWFLGPSGRLAVGDIAARLAETEVGQYAMYPRFRPIYYILRLLETAAWGRDPALWYGARITMLIVSLGLFWLLVSPVVGDLGGALLCAYALSFPFWVEIFGRLGPSETYAVVGLAIYLAAFVSCLRQMRGGIRCRLLSAAGILVGALLAVGSKENMLILVLPTAYLGYLAGTRRQAAMLASVALTLAVSALVGYGILLATARSGTDVYGQDVAIGARIEEILLFIRDNGFRSPLTVMAAAVPVLLAALAVPGLSGVARSAIRKGLIWLVLLSLLYLSQWVFYGWSWPTGVAPRYSFPGLLFLPASVLLYYWVSERLVAPGEERTLVVPAHGLSFAASIVLAIIYHGSFAPVANALDVHVAESRRFTASIERISQELRSTPHVPLIVEAGEDVWADYERAYSYPRFLRAYQVANPFFLRTSLGAEGASPSGIHAQLAADLEKVSLEGNENYSPLPDWEETGGRCYSLMLSATRATTCTPLY